MTLYDKEFTKNENQLILIMLIGGLFISILSIIPTPESNHDVDTLLITVNVFYWAVTIIMINSVEHKATRRALQSLESGSGKQ